MKIKFLTINVFKGGLFTDNIVNFIKDENPDIIVMQEVNNPETGLIKRLKENVEYKYFKFAPMSVYPDGVKHGTFTLSKFMIANAQTTFFDVPYGVYDTEGKSDFSDMPRNMLHTGIKVSNVFLNVFNIHGIWGFDGLDNERRLKMSEIIVEQIKDKENVILAGDFNMNRNTKSIGNIEKYVHNVFEDELKTSFNMKHKTDPGYGTAVVDMIFISPNIKVLEHYCPPVDVSDHLPLVAVLEI